jgi:hypothetical protein
VFEVTDKGLDITAKISKAAGDITHLVKDGVLGAFSVGFRCKESDYMTETDGYKIKDAELFEVSVVSVPCNQGATFGLSKSFDSMDEYRKYQKETLQANSDATADAVKIEQPSGEIESSNTKCLIPSFSPAAPASVVTVRVKDSPFLRLSLSEVADAMVGAVLSITTTPVLLSLPAPILTVTS